MALAELKAVKSFWAAGCQDAESTWPKRNPQRSLRRQLQAVRAVAGQGRRLSGSTESAWPEPLAPPLTVLPNREARRGDANANERTFEVWRGDHSFDPLSRSPLSVLGVRAIGRPSCEEMLDDIIRLFVRQYPCRALRLNRASPRHTKVPANELTAHAEIRSERFRANVRRIRVLRANRIRFHANHPLPFVACHRHSVPRRTFDWHHPYGGSCISPIRGGDIRSYRMRTIASTDRGVRLRSYVRTNVRSCSRVRWRCEHVFAPPLPPPRWDIDPHVRQTAGTKSAHRGVFRQIEATYEERRLHAVH